jgi:hypothetical protein
MQSSIFNPLNFAKLVNTITQSPIASIISVSSLFKIAFDNSPASSNNFIHCVFISPLSNIPFS